MTNYEKIKQMSAEELADFIGQATYCCAASNCKKCPLTKINICASKYIKKWLEREVDTDE